jgi:hypothetical protein
MQRTGDLVDANQARHGRRRRRVLLRGIAAASLIGFGHAESLGAECPGNAPALGTSRVLNVDAATTPRVGRKQFPATLPLAPKEVVLTFDDTKTATAAMLPAFLRALEARGDRVVHVVPAG